MYNVEWRQQYTDPARDEALGKEAATDFTDEEDMTVQSFKDETDINTIMAKFGITGQLDVSVREPFYGDFTMLGDFHTTLEAVRAAQEQFDALPPKIREYFKNDPGELLAFIQDPDNIDEARRIGLLPTREPSPEPGVLKKSEPPTPKKEAESETKPKASD